MNNTTIQKELDGLKKNLKKTTSSFLGYPCNTDLHYKELFDFFYFPLNNIGDPFIESLYRVNTRKYEREVLEFFAKLYNLPKNNFWGYVTSGGTEGNLYGLFMAREFYPQGILYFSEDSHYSIQKIARILNMKYIMIRSDQYGEIDYSDFEAIITVNRQYPAICSLNIGTTMKGAIDNSDRIYEILQRNNIHNFYIHADAALFGMMVPFIKNAAQLSFKKHISSIAISGHKFIGSPIPCGVVLTKKEYTKRIERKIEYIGTLDTTILGSRNGHTPLILWYAIKTRGLEGFRQEVEQCLKMSEYLYTKLQQAHYPSCLNQCSNTVYFKKPSKKLIEKWQLAISDKWAHIVVLQHVTKAKLDAFLNDLFNSK